MIFYKKQIKNKIKILSFFILILVSLQTIFAGTLTQIVINPYNQESNTRASTNYPSGVSSSPTYTFLDTSYNEIHNLLRTSYEPYCKFGGQYTINVTNNPEVTSIQRFNKKLFYCITTQDLLNQIKIPSSWEENNMILYCNDGNLIYSKDLNYDFLTSKVNTYKLCVLKNLDLEEKNTIIYGFEVGNRLVDSRATHFFNESSNKGILSGQLTINENLTTTQGNIKTYHFSGNNKNYIYEYNSANKYYTFREEEIENLNTNLQLPQINSINLGLTRTLLFKFNKDSAIYGYESAAKLQTTTMNSEIIPIYKIYSSGINTQYCRDLLATYTPATSITSTTKIACQNNEIIINSKALDNSKINGYSFNLFKNIILGFENSNIERSLITNTQTYTNNQTNNNTLNDQNLNNINLN